MQGVGPGSVLGGRYGVALRTSEGAHHERWRANDHTLEREVVLVCFQTSSPVAAAALDAARRAAGIEDPRLVRVLDVGSDGPVSFIVEEPLTGALPLSHLLHAGGLPAEEVRRITGEAASALDRARHRGLHHQALTPSSVLRMPDGEIKVRGLATEAALTGTDRASDERALRIDAVGLVKIAYAGLTGRWPMGYVPDLGRPTGLEAAPSIVGGVAAPSEIAVGIPNDLDLICRMTLNEGRGPVSPGDLARQIAPWPSEMPKGDGTSGIGLRAAHEDVQPTRVLQDLDYASTLDAAARALPRTGQAETDPYATFPELRTAPDQTGVGSVAPGSPAAEAAAAAAPPAPGASPAGGAAAGLTAAGAAAAGAASAIGDRVGSFARAAADKAAARAAERRASYHGYDAEDVALSEALDEAPTAPLDSPVPVFGSPSAPSGPQSRIALAIVGVLVVVALVIGINNVAKIGQHDQATGDGAVATVTRTRSPSQSATPGTSRTRQAPTTTDQQPSAGGPVSIVGAKSFDPQDDNTESPNLVPLAFDGDPKTYWKSRWYGSDNYNGKKDGVGLVLDLSSPTVIKEVDLTLPAAQDVTVYAASTDSLAGAQKIGSVKDQSGTVTITADGPLQPATKVIVWVTKAAPDEAPNHFRAQIAEVAVH